MAIIILGSHKTKSIGLVCQKISDIGADYVILDYDMYAEPGLCSLTEADQGYNLVIGDRSFSDDKIHAFYYDLCFGDHTVLKDIEPEDAHNYVAEWRYFYATISRVFSDKPAINNYDLMLSWESKPRQLQLARQVGLDVPETIFSSNPDQVRSFMDPNKDYIFKVFTNDFGVESSKWVYTTPIKQSDIDSYAENIKVTPAIYQQKIDKAYDLRIIIVGDQIFPVRLESQSVKGAELDWRKAESGTVTGELTQLDLETEKLLRDYHKRTGLVYGAYDFAVEKETGKHYFLEVNPNGLWLRLEEKTPGLDISGAIAEQLVLMSKNNQS